MNKIIKSFSRLLLAGLLIFTYSCERDLEELELATFPANGLVFDDTFGPGLTDYSAFGGSKLTGFQVVDDVKFSGTSSMQFEVPDFEDPGGSFVGGAFIVNGARDLSGFNVLSFYAKASESEFIGEVGFGNDFGSNTFVASLTNIPVTTNWKKYYIPIPDASKLTAERGLLFLSEGPDAEEGRGYTFWIDDVQFENEGTVVAVNSGIFNGEDQTETVETGALFFANGFVTYNLPTGVDQRSNASPAYFEFTSSDPSVAIVDENGAVAVIGPGEAKITASIGGVESVGSLTITSTGDPILPAGPAPTPTAAAEDVISLFSNAYQDEPVDFYNGFWEFSTTQSSIVQVENDDIIRYSQLNFVGIQFTSPTIDISDMTRVHLDIWTPDATPAGSEFKVLLVDLGADGNFGGDDDSSFEVTFTPPTLQTEQWVSIDLPLTDFPGLTGRTSLAQVVLSGNLPNIFLDNLYFYDDGNGGGTGGDDEPTMAAPTPSQAASNVISLFSDAYTDVPVDTWRTEWSDAVFEDVMIAGNATKKYSALNFVGIETVMNQVDISGMTHFRMDVWSPNATEFRAKLVDFGPNGTFEGPGNGDDTEHEVVYGSPAQGEWISYDIPLTDFVGLTTQENLAQLILGANPAGGSTIFVDNIFFYNDDGGGGNPTEPTMAAPTPSQAEADVISLFSDAYTDVSVDTWRTEWSDATFEDVMVAGNATKKYTALNFVGIETVMNQIDITGMTNFRMDIWTPDITELRIKLVDFGPNGAFDGPGNGDDTEHEVINGGPAQGQWVSLDIPLSDFIGLTSQENLAQLILGATPVGTSTLFVDNVYFYNADGGGGDLTEPDTGAPTPGTDQANVISLFSDAYSDVPVDTWRTEWSDATFEDVMVAGNPTKKYSALNFVGIETVMNQVDISSMTHFRMDVWTADATQIRIKLVDFGPNGVFDGPGNGDDTEHEVTYDNPAQMQWISYDIPLSDFTGLTGRGNFSQLIISGAEPGQNTVFVDNVYFRN